MHFTETVYRNPYWPTFPLLQITQGCTHNRCKFCTMYRDVPFKPQSMEWIEADLRELSQLAPDATMILDLADGVNPNSDAACIISRCSVLQIATHGFGLCIPFSVS